MREQAEENRALALDQEGGGVNSGRAYFEKIFNYDQFGAKFPFTVQPNLKLIDANEGLQFQRYDLIELDSFHNTGPHGRTSRSIRCDAPRIFLSKNACHRSISPQQTKNT